MWKVAKLSGKSFSETNTVFNRVLLLRNLIFHELSFSPFSVTFDLTNKDYEDLTFASDGYYCGRGFKAIYEQISCSAYPGDPGYPNRSSTMPTPTYPGRKCGRTIQDRRFALEVYGDDIAPCVFNVVKTDPVSACILIFYYQN